MKNKFLETFEKFKKYYQVIELTDEMFEAAEEFTEAVIQEKLKEEQYKKDGGQIHTRFMTGILGEFVIYESLGYPWCMAELDVGNTELFRHADLSFLDFENVGIKSVEMFKFPLIYQNKDEYEIVVVIDKEQKLGYVVGIASPKILNSYSSSDLVKSPAAKAKGKVGFYGLDHCYRYKDEEDLRLFIEKTSSKKTA